MSIHAALTHRTSYRYDRPVVLGPQTIRLRPAPHARTGIVSYALDDRAEAAFPELAAGPAGQFPGPRGVPGAGHPFRRDRRPGRRHDHGEPVRLLPRTGRRNLPLRYDPVLEQELAPFRKAASAGSAAGGLAGRGPARRAAHGGYAGGAEPHGADAASPTSCAWNPASGRRRKRWATARGSCRDSAWVLVQLLRNLGYAARFVSGYLIQLGCRRETAGGAGRSDRRLHRPARLGRGVSAGRRMDRTGCDLRVDGGRGAYPAGRQPRSDVGRADLRRGRTVRGRVRVRNVGAADQRNARASPSRIPRRSGRTSWPPARASIARWRRAMCG